MLRNSIGIETANTAAVFVRSLLQRLQEIRHGLHHVIGHTVLLLRRLAVSVSVRLLQRGDAREREDGRKPAVGAEQNVRLQAVADHQRARRIQVELTGDALVHEAAGLPDDRGLPAAGRF